MIKNKKLLVLTSGGDSPGMNAAIRAVVRTAHHFGIQPFGCQSGYQGLVNSEIFSLSTENVANCIQHGGTLLKADRSISFFEKQTRLKCGEFLLSNGIHHVIVIGGNGSLKGATLFARETGLSVIGIPGTIDNDIEGSEYTIGFDTARNTALDAIDRIRDTASSHNRHFLIEVMGRHSGFLAVDVGIAGGAEMILIPEFETPVEKIANRLSSARHKLSSIIVVAESGQPGRTFLLSKELEKLTGVSFRVCILGHTQRGGSPTLLDRKIASQMGYLAVKMIMDNLSQMNSAITGMVAMLQNKILLVPFPSIESGPRVLSEMELISMNDILCS